MLMLQKSFFILLVFQFQCFNTIDVETTKHCCGLGTNHSSAGNDCSTFHAPIPKVTAADSESCMHFFGVCCAKKKSELECQAGEELALSGQDCKSANGGKKICCESCMLGKAAASGNPSCIDLGLGSSFVKCCQSALATSTTEAITTSSSTPKLEPNSSKPTDRVTQVENVCEVEDICAQICVPIGDSYKCDCHKGYSLMDDKVSCKPDQKTRKGTSRCDMNNPCEHECLDTGVAVKCLCHDGYELDVDNTSCKDIDECAMNIHECTNEEVCVNGEGIYYCDDPNYTDSANESEKKCPVGYKFNGLTASCDDIDECEISLLCPSPKICQNTIGSYKCQGEDIKCPPGFYYKAATESCTDIDECITGENNCNKESQICINTKGNYTCAEKVSTKGCPAGFKKNPYTQQCDDVDECADETVPPLCAPSEQCINEKGSYNCVSKTRVTISSTASSTQSSVYAHRFSPRRTTPIPTIPPTRRVPLTQRPLTCSKGFTASADGRTCIDLNECQLGTHSCRDTQRCDNTIGSYHCVRMAGCGTGYTYNYAEELCEDDDECELGTHNCGGLGSGFKCRNTQGSYRCDPVRRPPVTIRTTTYPPVPKITDLTIISGQKKTCLPGFLMNSRGNCEDIDECKSNPCGKSATCFNLPGRYECINKVQCKAGYDLNQAGDDCEDVNECVRGIHKCNPTQICRNGDGYYTCVCPPGHHLNPQTSQCEDIDECKYYKVCYHNSNCVNTVGSYRCECKEGFRDNGRGCEDIDECAENPNRCEHRCVNIWGSYRCACQSGFTLNRDNRTCNDINECETFKDKKLCIGSCENVPGSYKCSCPRGYRLGTDKRTCQDIDECERKVCPNHNDICVNTRGSYKCHTINCPPHYIRDPQHKSRCKRPQSLCDARDLACVQKPEQYTYHFIALVSNLPISNGHINLFAIQGPVFARARTEFSFRIVDVQCPRMVPRINANNFRMDVQNYNAMKLYLIRSITGPQEAELEIKMKLYDNNQLIMSAISRLFLIVTEYPF